MLARYTGACLGLFAFSVAVIAGMWVHNPPMVVLSRAVWALFLFCMLGLFLGKVAQVIVDEHYRRRERAMLGPEAELTGAEGSGGASPSPEARTEIEGLRARTG